MRSRPAESPTRDHRRGGHLGARLPKTLLLDMDDTVFDHALTCRAALRRLHAREPALQTAEVDSIWREYGRLLEAAHPDVVAGTLTPQAARIERFRALGRFCGTSISASEAERLSREYRSEYQKARRLVPGARELLQWLHGRSVVALVSNSLVEEQEEKLAFFGLRQFVDHMVVSEGVGVSKPEARIFEIALERADALPADSVMLGDSWANDVLGARSAGIRAVWFNRFGLPNPEPEAVRELTSLKNLRRVVEVLSATATPG